MMNISPKYKFFLVIPFFLIIVAVVFLSVKSVGEKKDIRRHAVDTTMTLAFYPTSSTLSVNETKSFDLIATFINGSPSQTIDYFKTAIVFSKDYLKVPFDKYVDTSSSGFDKIINVDGPIIANQNGKISIELGAGSPNSSVSTNKPITIAKIFFQATAQTVPTQHITIGDTQVIKSDATVLSFDKQNSQDALYSIVASDNSILTPTITASITASPTITSQPASSPTLILTPTVAVHITPSVTPSYTGRNMFNPNAQTNSTSGFGAIPSITNTAVNTNTFKVQNSIPTAAVSPYNKPSPTQILTVKKEEIPSLEYASPTLTPTVGPVKGIFSFLANLFHLVICTLTFSCR